jgi:cytochrome c-type biogenesis protein CcmH/NrfG
VSRLADILMRMDEKRAHRPGLGGIPHLGESAGPRRQWRIVGTLVIVVSMGALSLTLWLRPQVSAPPAAKPPALISVPASVSLATTPAPPPRERVASLIQDGLVAARNGEIETAAAAFRQASDIDPSDAEAWTNLGVVLIRAGDEARGVEAFRRALRAVPGYPEAHRNLAVTLDRQGRVTEAARHYRAFLAGSAADNPDRATILARLEEMSAGRPAE